MDRPTKELQQNQGREVTITTDKQFDRQTNSKKTKERRQTGDAFAKNGCQD